MTRPARAIPEPLAVNLTDAAAFLNKSIGQIKRYVRDGKLPVSRKLGTPLIPMSAIREAAGETAIKGKAK